MKYYLPALFLGVIGVVAIAYGPEPRFVGLGYMACCMSVFGAVGMAAAKREAKRRNKQ